MKIWIKILRTLMDTFIETGGGPNTDTYVS